MRRLYVAVAGASINNRVEFSKEWTELGQINPSKVAALARRPKKITNKTDDSETRQKGMLCKSFRRPKVKNLWIRANKPIDKYRMFGNSERYQLKKTTCFLLDAPKKNHFAVGDNEMP